MVKLIFQPLVAGFWRLASGYWLNRFVRHSEKTSSEQPAASSRMGDLILFDKMNKSDISLPDRGLT